MYFFNKLRPFLFVGLRYPPISEIAIYKKKWFGDKLVINFQIQAYFLLPQTKSMLLISQILNSYNSKVLFG